MFSFDFLEFLELLAFFELLEFGNGVFSFGIFGIGSWCLVLDFINCEMLLFSMEFVFLQENFKAQGTCAIFRTVLNLPQFDFLFKFACLYNVCLYL